MITMYFGSPGCGKSTWLSKIVAQNYYKFNWFNPFNYIFFWRLLFRLLLHRNRRCYVSDEYPVKGAYLFNVKRDFGYKEFPRGSLILIDEASVYFNNRNYKNLSPRVIDFLKHHRHYGVDIIFFSQSWDDVDITIRRMTVKLFYTIAIPKLFSIARKVKCFVHIEKEKKQIMDGHWFSSIFSILLFAKPIQFCFMPKYWKMFDSFCTKPLPELKTISASAFPGVGFANFLKLLSFRFLCKNFPSLSNKITSRLSRQKDSGAHKPETQEQNADPPENT